MLASEPSKNFKYPTREKMRNPVLSAVRAQARCAVAVANTDYELVAEER